MLLRQVFPVVNTRVLYALRGFLSTRERARASGPPLQRAQLDLQRADYRIKLLHARHSTRRRST